MGLLAAVIPALVGGLLGRNEDKRNAARAVAANEQQRGWQNEDYLRERADFAYDRDHAWKRQHEWRDSERFLGRQDVLEGREYNEAQLDQQTASRGIDFQKLRDQAQAAGFNPLTVLGNASMYSTERAANLSSGGAGPLTGGGGGAVSFGASGRGYSAAVAPSISSAGFVTEALTRGLDTYFNTPPETDPLADALRHAQEEGERQRQAERRQVPRSFGYDLTEARPFSPAAVSSIPRLSKANAEVASSGKPPGITTWVGGRQYKGAPGWTSAGDAEEEYGEIRGEAQGLARGFYDDGYNLGLGPVGKAFSRWKAGPRGRSYKVPKLKPNQRASGMLSWPYGVPRP